VTDELARPLSGVTLIECCDGVAGAYAAKMLGDLGADVIKIETPTERGIELRRQPPFVSVAPPLGAMFAFLNAGKTFITLDAGTQDGRALLAELAGQAQVLIYDVPVEGRPSRGIESQTLRREFPDLVVVSVLPYGESGPRSGVPAHAVNVFHACGEGALLPNGLSYDLFPDRPPLSAYGQVGSLQAGIGAAVAVLAALYAPAGGQILDLSEQDMNVGLSGMTLQRFGDGVTENRRIRSYAYGGVIECSDGFVELLILEQRQWLGLVDMMGRPAWALDPRLDDPHERAMAGQTINQQLRSWARDRTVEEVTALAKRSGVPVGAYASPEDVLNSRHEASRDFFRPLDVGGAMSLQAPALPFRFLPGRDAFGGGRVRLTRGEDNEDVFLKRLGKSTEDLERWLATGVV
jgi:crotonobetainyl-CoA:carnitine CoA-transferase CaiB-like acyl-CoA transferase